jgi:hypothetical protein
MKSVDQSKVGTSVLLMSHLETLARSRQLSQLALQYPRGPLCTGVHIRWYSCRSVIHLHNPAHDWVFHQRIFTPFWTTLHGPGHDMIYLQH